MNPIKRSQILVLSAVAFLMFGCSNGIPSFSILPDESNFQQNADEINGKIDVLWVIDNSGSMASSQQNVVDNFSSFIQKFQEKNLDFRMAVTTSDAYRSNFTGDMTRSKFRDGTWNQGYSGVFVIEPTTPNLNDVFLTNILQGIQGDGDERVFQSISATLDNPLNQEWGAFPRPDAFLAVIIVSDEDDFSHDGADFRGGQYSYSGLHTVDSYVSYLDGITSSTTLNRNYNVSTITIMDQACLDYLNALSGGRKIGLRYLDLSSKTNGVVGSLCDDFGPTLASISNKIIELSTQFQLNRIPREETIQVYVDGQLIPQDATNGWSYNATNNSIYFHGSAVPSPGAIISVKFDPKSVQ